MESVYGRRMWEEVYGKVIMGVRLWEGVYRQVPIGSRLWKAFMEGVYGGVYRRRSCDLTERYMSVSLILTHGFTKSLITYWAYIHIPVFSNQMERFCHPVEPILNFES